MKTSVLQDDFQWGTIDGKWSTLGDAMQITEANLFLNITHAASFQYNTLISTATYDLTSSNFFVNLIDAGNQSFLSHEAIMGLQLDGSNLLWFTISENTISAFKKVAGVQAQVGSSIPYNATTHAWLRIRESGGTTFWDTSPDGATWTNRFFVANPFALTAIQPYLQSGCYGSESSGSYANFTNFNLTPGQLQFQWMGFTWNKRIQNGPSMYNNNWSSDNVISPDQYNQVVLNMTNPTGSSPIGAEFYSVNRNFGYGTYQATIGSEVDNMHPAVVFGNFFLFDFTQPPSYNEMDVGEVRHYNPFENTQILLNHFYNNGGNNAVITDIAPMVSTNLWTIRMIWSPTSIIFDAFEGPDTTGRLIFHFVQTTNIASPVTSRIHCNLWVQNNASPNGATPVSVILKNFSYTSVVPGAKAAFIKTYIYRVFAPGVAGGYITTWTKEVISDPEFVTNINGFPGELDVRLARSFDDFGEGVDVALNNRVECWCVDVDAPNGVLVYSGYIADYLPIIDGQNGTEESVTVVLLSYGGELDRNILRDGAGNTTLIYTTTDPADILKDAIQKYQATGGILKYTASSIQRANQLVTYEFNTNTIHEVLDQCVAMAPYGFYWYVGPDNVIYFKQRHIVADHLVTLGLNAIGLETDRRLENIVNRILITGGGSLYRKYEFQGSQLQYGIYEAKYIDTRLTDVPTAQYIANAILTGQQNPEIRSTFNALDNNGKSQKYGMNIESIAVGDTIQIQNVKISTKTVSLWDVASWDVDVWDQTITTAAQDIIQIISIDYQPDASQIQASSRLPVIAKRVEEIARQLIASQTVNNPTAPV